MASAEVFNLPNGKEHFCDNIDEKELNLSSSEVNNHLEEKCIIGDGGSMFDDAFDLNGDTGGGALEENESLSDAGGKDQDCNLCQ